MVALPAIHIKVIVRAGEFKSAETVSKRYADVRLFLSAFPRFKLLNSFFWGRTDGNSDRFVLTALLFEILPHLSYIAIWVACPISGFLDPNFKSSENEPPADDPRAMIAFARVNWLHSRYKVVGCLHPRFVKTYEFRCFVVKR